VKELIYIAGKYTDPTHNGVWENVERAKQAIPKLYKQGYLPFCPHTMSSFMGGSLSSNPVTDYEGWLEIDFAFLRKCDAIYMLKDWEQSKGAVREHELAKELGLKIIYE
jgi:hypothetical protein